MQCTAISIKNGKQCKAQTTLNSEFCFFHNPELKEKRLEVSRQPKKPKPKNDVPVMVFQSIKDIPNILQRLMNDVYKGNITIGIAKTIDSLLNTAIKAYGEGENKDLLNEITQKIQEIEEQNNLR